MDNFKHMQEYVDAMQATSKTSEKEAILRGYRGVDQFITQCVFYTLNPEYMYGVTSEQIKKRFKETIFEYQDKPYTSLFDLLDDLRNRVITGHEAIDYINDYILRHDTYGDLILNIIDKDIKTRANATLVNKVWGKGFIPKFEVALAQPWEAGKVDYSDDWRVSRKLNGLRGVCKIDHLSNARFFTRTGKEFFTLDVLKDSIKRAGITNIVFDGEICIMRDSIEDFKAIQTEYKKRNHTIIKPVMKVFDVLTHDEFNNGSSIRRLMDRVGSFEAGFASLDGFDIVEQGRVCSDDQVVSALGQAESLGWEGLVLRKNVGYKGRRSKDILKVKKFKDAEYVVKSIDIGSMRFIEDGQDTSRMTMRSVEITHKGQRVDVGSGWTKAERAEFYLYPWKILGRIITVKYKQESCDSEGKVSLEYPTLKAIHDGGGRDA